MWTGFLAVLPQIARLVLAVQAAAGVQHRTVVGAIAEWILRGDRRQRIEEPDEPKRVLDRIGFEPLRTPAPAPRGTEHGDPYRDPPT